ncbi:MAG: hypothetical protein ACREFX_02660 [Opitutaceae bacterium]
MMEKIRLALAVAAVVMVGGTVPALRAQDTGGNGDSGLSGPAQDVGGQQTLDSADDPSTLPPPQPDQPNRQTPQLTDNTSTAFQKLEPLLNAKKWDQALVLIDQTMAKTDPNTYDMAVMLDTKAKLLLEEKNDYAGAIVAWEKALRLYRAHPNFYRRQDVLNMMLGLAQLNYQLAASDKSRTAEAQKYQTERLDRAIGYMRAWMRSSPVPDANQIQFYALVLYYRASVNAKHIDMGYMKEAAAEAHAGLLLTIFPRASFYQLIVAALQQEGDMKKAAEYLQLLVKMPGANSSKRNYWTELVAIYSNLAGNTTNDPRVQRAYYAQAINTLEHAQSLGLMKTPSDNFNLVTMYYDVGQYGRAIDLLHQGLNNGSIADTLLNWQRLSYFYQEEDRDLDAIDVLKEAERRFPHDAMVDYSICQLYEGLDRGKAAFQYIKRAITKTGPDNPKGSLDDSHLFTAYQVYAYYAFVLKDFPESLNAIARAEKLKGDTAGKEQMLRLKDAVLNAKKLQDNAAAAAKALRAAEQAQKKAEQEAARQKAQST